MRASNQQSGRGFARWLLALLCATTCMTVWAQERSGEETPPQPPAPPAAVEAPAPPQTDKQVRILRDEDGSLRIMARDENGERTEVQVDLGDDFGGAVSRRVVEQLHNSGILDERGRVTAEAMNSVPRNVSIGISGGVGQARDHQGFHDHSDFPFKGDLAVLIPIIAILAVFGAPVLIVWLVTRTSYRKKQLMMDNINRLVAEGRDIPPELLDAMQGESPSNMKDRGFTLIAVGLALFIWLTISAGPGVGSLGLIPLFIGVARFINWKLDHKQPGAN